MSELLQKYHHEIERILAKYPQDQKRSAVLALLHLAQREGNVVSDEAVFEIAGMLMSV